MTREKTIPLAPPLLPVLNVVSISVMLAKRVIPCLDVHDGKVTRGVQIGVSIDAKRVAPDKWEVFSHGGRKSTGLDAVEWAKRAVSLGAGEIVLNSIDADGTKAGFDLVITRRISESVGVPVVASGGAGKLEHMAEVLLEGKADAVLAASIFHFGTYTVGDVKKFFAKQNIPVRL